MAARRAEGAGFEPAVRVNGLRFSRCGAEAPDLADVQESRRRQPTEGCPAGCAGHVFEVVIHPVELRRAR
jgi:hypothetical protein